MSTQSGSMDLRGQVAIVTGGGRGIGRAIAERLAAEGAAVAVLARTQAEVAETASTIERAGGRALALIADVTDRVAVVAAVAHAQRTLGPIDLLVNNAAVVTPLGPVWSRPRRVVAQHRDQSARPVPRRVGSAAGHGRSAQRSDRECGGGRGVSDGAVHVGVRKLEGCAGAPHRLSGGRGA